METIAAPAINTPLISDPYENYRYFKNYPTREKPSYARNIDREDDNACSSYGQKNGNGQKLILAIVSNIFFIIVISLNVVFISFARVNIVSILQITIVG